MNDGLNTILDDIDAEKTLLKLFDHFKDNMDLIIYIEKTTKNPLIKSLALLAEMIVFGKGVTIEAEQIDNFFKNRRYN